MFNWIDKSMNESDIVWRWAHQKYVMFQIGQKINSIGKTTALTLLLQMMFDWIDVTINESDEIWRWVQQKYEMIRIGWKLHLI